MEPLKAKLKAPRTEMNEGGREKRKEKKAEKKE